MSEKYIEVSEIISKARILNQTHISIEKLDKMPCAEVVKKKSETDLLKEFIHCPSCGNEYAYDLIVGCRGYSGEHGYSAKPEIQCYGARKLKVCCRCGTVYMSKYDLNDIHRATNRAEPFDQTNWIYNNEK